MENFYIIPCNHIKFVVGTSLCACPIFSLCLVLGNPPAYCGGPLCHSFLVTSPHFMGSDPRGGNLFIYPLHCLLEFCFAKALINFPFSIFNFPFNRRRPLQIMRSIVRSFKFSYIIIEAKKLNAIYPIAAAIPPLRKKFDMRCFLGV